MSMRRLTEMVPKFAEIPPTIQERIAIESKKFNLDTSVLEASCQSFFNPTTTIIGRYRTFLDKQEADIHAFRRDEELMLPEDIDYDR